MTMKIRCKTRFSTALIFLVTFTLTQSALSQISAGELPSIPGPHQGLFVSAICGRGCEKPNLPCDVYVLTEKEYKNYIQNNLKIQSKGKTPLFLPNLNPGIYYVGIDAPINTSTVPMTGGSLTPLKPDYQKFFIDDLPFSMQHVLSSVPAITPTGKKAFRVVFTFRKWYRISVEKDAVSPIVAIYLDKQASLVDWEKLYPKKDRFKLIPGAEFQMEFLDAVEKSSGVSIDDRELFISLLKRGGRVCVPRGALTTVVSINSRGLPEAKSIVSASSVSENPEKVTAITPNRRISEKLPKFEVELQGSNEVRVVNPNEFNVVAGIRSSNKGKDFNIPAKSRHSVFIPDGNFDIYFIYSNEPKALYQGESFTLSQNGVEIQIVKVVGGNYASNRK